MALSVSVHLSTSDQREPLAQLGVGPPYGFAVGGEGLHQTCRGAGLDRASVPTYAQPVNFKRIRHFVTPFDARFEEMKGPNWKTVVWRDLSAAMVVAMMAIPMAMGFAIAAGLRPENGIVAGAIAGIVGGLFGGSKYNTYGPVAALIPVIAGIMAAKATATDPYAGHAFIVLVCVCAGVILVVMSLLGLGSLLGNLVPHSIVVGFSVGIAVTIGVSQLGEVLGLSETVRGSFVTQLQIIARNINQLNWAALLVAALTFVVTHGMLKISRYVPGPMIGLGLGTVLGATVLADNHLALIKTKYGAIPTDFLMWAAPQSLPTDLAGIGELAFYAFAFAIVCGFEGLLCARMADRMADNKGTPYDPDKEFWGQGLILMFVPLLKGMPLSGALARTATKVQVGGVTPLAEIMKSVLKLLMVYFLARQLELVPLACIGGILLWVAFNMVKPKEITGIWKTSRFQAALMVYTAVVVIFFGFLEGVLSGTALYWALRRWFETPSGAAAATQGH